MDVPAIRKDFPVLQGDDAPIFFDSACTTLRPAQVLEAMNDYYEKYPSCGGRSIHKFGTRVTLEVDDREFVVLLGPSEEDPSLSQLGKTRGNRIREEHDGGD